MCSVYAILPSDRIRIASRISKLNRKRMKMKSVYGLKTVEVTAIPHNSQPNTDYIFILVFIRFEYVIDDVDD